MARDPASHEVSSAQEFLELRQRIASDDPLLAQFDDDQLRTMCQQWPDDAARVLDVLAHSVARHDKEAAAIYVGYLLDTRREPASRLLRELLADADESVRDTAADTVTAAVETGRLDPVGAARLYQ